MAGFLEFLETNSFSLWVALFPLAYSTILALHTIGMAFLVGLSAMIALRVLGFAPGVPLAPMEKLFPLIIIGFWVNAASGLVLFMLEASNFLTNPNFFIKMTAIACAVVTLRSLRTAVFRSPAKVASGPHPAKARALAAALLVCWGVGVTAGRLTAYSGITMWQSAVAVAIVAFVVLASRYVGARLLAAYRPVNQVRAAINK